MGIDCRIAVLGAGNLGSAFIVGLLKAQAVPAERIVATVRTQNHADVLSRALRVEACAGGNTQAVAQSDVVIVAVKPAVVAEVLAEIRKGLGPRQILVSLAAGVPLPHIERAVGPATPVFRAMPNLAMRICESATAISAGSRTTGPQRSVITEIFEAVGTVHFVEDEAMHAVTALAGSGPGFLYWMMEAFAQGGTQAGLQQAVSSALTAQTFLGASRLVRETGEAPGVLRRQVTTPGGTTAAGVAELESRGTLEAVVAAIAAATRRSRDAAEALDKGSAKER